MKKFSFGTIIGISSLILVPLLASAASASSVGAEKPARERPIPSQECLQAQVAMQDLMSSTMEQTQAARTAAMQAHRDALTAAAKIADDTQRQEALTQAHEAFRTAMENFRPAESDAFTEARDAVRTACGDAGGRGMGLGMGMGMGGGFGVGHTMGGGKGMGRGMHQGCQQSSAAQQ
ncbi:MAG: hypothetical protein Q7S29_00720 [Candidatus Peribacter sp.]|nr:hypothetical protein [Candidatus Peribacter sp.]